MRKNVSPVTQVKDTLSMLRLGSRLQSIAPESQIGPVTKKSMSQSGVIVTVTGPSLLHVNVHTCSGRSISNMPVHG